MRRGIEMVRTCSRRPVPAARRLAAAALLPVLVALAGARCFGDLVHPSQAAIAYAFTAPLTDTMVNVGDTTDFLACRLTAGDRDIGCTLEVTVTEGGRLLVVADGRLAAIALGRATVEMRPLNVQLTPDTIVRTAQVHTVVPRVVWGSSNAADTAGPGVMKMLVALPETRSGQVIAGALIQWVQDSGLTVAHLVPGLPGWVQADAVGVAVFRAVTDTASSPPRRLVVLAAPPVDRPAAAAGGARR